MIEIVRRILVVEDDLDHLAILRWILVGMGFVVIWSADLASARAVLAESPPPALVILDRILPDGDGLALCRETTARSPAVPVLILTAQSGPRLADEARAAGAAECLTKPFEPAELEAVVGGSSSPRRCRRPPAGPLAPPDGARQVACRVLA